MSKYAGKVAKRYARALLSSYDTPALEEIDTALSALSALWQESAELKNTLKNPAFNLTQRLDAWKAVVVRVRAGDEKFANFCAILLQRGRLDELPGISEAFFKMLLEIKDLLAVTITSAFSPSEEERRDFQETLQREFGALASLEWKIDDSLIGGSKVQLGDKLLDTSVRGTLDRLKAELMPA
ncbi:MAG: ATP synthase F1 subunit delta [Deltaproteobacteria bacterium]|nr:ATP synthase F1 subunit delta [Deltaproteobacteria bacterium]